MRTDRVLKMLLAGALALAGAAGCAGPSASSDLARIRSLSGAQRLPSVASEEVEGGTSAEARPLLAKPLTADSAVRVALLNNRALRAMLREVGVARGELMQAGVLPNPEIGVEVMPRQAGLEHAHIELEVEYDLTSTILAPVRERAAQAELEAARYRAAAAVVELGYAVRAAFHAVQASQQRLGIANRALDALAAGRDAARALFEAGNIAELDVATQEAGYEAARITASQIELEMLERRERLQRLLGLSGAETGWKIAAELPAAPEALALPERAEARAISASLELAEMKSRLEAAARRAGALRTEGALPDVSVALRGEREDEAWLVGGAVRMTLPIFNRNQGAATSREAEFDSLLERYHGAAIDVRSALRDARNRVASAHARALHYQRAILPARKRVAEQAVLQYNAMQIGVFQLLQVRREQLDAELAQVETLREYWTAQAALEALLQGRRVGGAEMTGTAAPAAMPGAATGDGGGH